MTAKIDKAIRELEECIKRNEQLIEKSKLLIEQLKSEGKKGKDSKLALAL